MKTTRLSIPFLGALLFLAPVAFAEDAKSIITSTSPGDKVEQWFEEDPFFPPMHAVATSVGGKIHGEAHYYDEQGHLIMVDSFDHGVRRLRTTYYPGGKKFGETKYEDGKPAGESTVWFEDGTVESIITYAQGIPHGRHIMYFTNGNKMLEGENAEGQPQGRRFHYLPDGTQFGITSWRDGQQVDQQVLKQPSSSEAQVIADRNRRSPMLKDHWKQGKETPQTSIAASPRATPAVGNGGGNMDADRAAYEAQRRMRRFDEQQSGRRGAMRGY